MYVTLYVTLSWIICGRRQCLPVVASYSSPPCPVLLRPQPGLSSQHRSASGLARIQVHKNNTGQYRYMNYKYKCRTQVQLSLDGLSSQDRLSKVGFQVQVHTSASRGMASWQHSSSVTQPTQHRSQSFSGLSSQHYTCRCRHTSKRLLKPRWSSHRRSARVCTAPALQM